MDVHIGEDDVRVAEANRKFQVVRQAKGRVEKNVVHVPMPFPKLSIQVVIPVIGIRTMKMDEVSAKQTGHQHHATE
jgi:hypothetical protein